VSALGHKGTRSPDRADYSSRSQGGNRFARLQSVARRGKPIVLSSGPCGALGHMQPLAKPLAPRDFVRGLVLDVVLRVRPLLTEAHGSKAPWCDVYVSSTVGRVTRPSRLVDPTIDPDAFRARGDMLLISNYVPFIVGHTLGRSYAGFMRI